MHIIQYKGYDIKAHSVLPTSYIIVTSGKGGKIPAILEGMFTHPTICKGMIDAYLVTKTVKDVDNDKAVNQS